MMRTWVKLYTEILRDPKLHSLPDHRFRFCINLIALAGQIDENGRLGTADDVAFHLRLDAPNTAAELEELCKVSVTCNKKGVWWLKNWSKRNGKPLSDTRKAVRERVQKHRENKPKTDEVKRDGNAGVTPLHDAGNAPRGEEIREEEKREEESKSVAGAKTAPAAAAKNERPELEELLIANSRPGTVLQAELEQYYQSKRRSVPRHFQSHQQRQAFEQVFAALGEKLQPLAAKGLARERSSLPNLLGWLQSCAKNEQAMADNRRMIGERTNGRQQQSQPEGHGSRSGQTPGGPGGSGVVSGGRASEIARRLSGGK